MRETFVVEVPKLLYPHVFLPKMPSKTSVDTIRYQCWMPIEAIPEKYREPLSLHVANARARDGTNPLRNHISAASMNPPLIVDREPGDTDKLARTLRIAQECRAPLDMLIADLPAILRLTIYDRMEKVQAIVGSSRAIQQHRLSLEAVGVRHEDVEKRWHTLQANVFIFNHPELRGE